MNLEIIGPSKSGFTTQTNGIEEFITYKTFAIGGRDANKLVNIFHQLVAKIIRDADERIIYWRQKPALFEIDGEGKFIVTCRLAISPDFSKEYWDELKIVKPEGQAVVEIGEL